MPPKLNTLTLKQRLAALSLSTSSPSPPRFQGFQNFSTPTSPSPRFTPPWIKRNKEPSPNADIYQEEEEIQSVLSKTIFQAGVDYETRPMVVMNASALPDPQLFNYDVLLARILAYLNLYVESDYTVIFFAAGGRHTPGWNWLWKAYRSLGRKYRKNLKQLYIVHSSFFTKMLFSFAGAMISPKFFRKMLYVETLSELAYHVPITQIDISPAVYKENAKHEDSITLPVPIRSGNFGVPLEELMGYYGEKGGIPRVVRDCIQYIRETALEEDGLFRRSAQSSLLRAAQDAYDRGNVVSLHTFGDPHIAAVLLKKFLRDLPEPIFPERLYPMIRQCPAPGSDLDDVSCVHYLRGTLLPELSPCAYILLSQVLHLMHEVSLRSSINRMNAHNLAIVLTLNLIKGKNPVQDALLFSVVPALLPMVTPGSVDNEDNADSRTTLGVLIKLCIQRYYEVFDDLRDPAEAATTVDSSLTMGDESIGTVASLGGSTAVESSLLCGSADSTHACEEEEIDDAMLVMPIGPSHSRNGSVLQGPGVKPDAWANTPKSGARKLQCVSKPPPISTSPPQRGQQDLVEVASSSATSTGTGNRLPYATRNRARSVVNVEKSDEEKRWGSISVGTSSGSRKGIGSGVEALGVTAAGFFSPPGPNT